MVNYLTLGGQSLSCLSPVNDMAGLLKILHLSGQRGSLCDGVHLELQGLPGQHPTALSESVEDNCFSVLTWK